MTRCVTAVHQVIPSLGARDAIGNEVLLMQTLLRGMGLESDIYFEQHGDPRLALPFGELFRKDIGKAALLYHFSVASTIPSRLAPLPYPKIVRYHNVTPPWFFNDRGEMSAREACRLGRDQIPMVSVIADRVLAASAYNAAEMAPFTRKTPDVLPVLRDYEKLGGDAASGKAAAHLAATGKQQIIYVGRLVPNKCQQDLLQLLHLAKKHLRPDLQLVLVGGLFSEDYWRALTAFADKMGLKVGTDLAQARDADVLAVRGIDDADLGALYRQAKAFVSMSEHEGFGVPLIEAMAFDLPVLAHAAAAVPETVGDAGLLCDKSDWAGTLAALRAVLDNAELRARLVAAGRERVKTVGLATTGRAFTAWIDRLFTAP